MKRFALFGVLGLLVMATGAASARALTSTDGTLTVKNGVGRIVIAAKGGAIGRFDRGSVTIKDPIPGDGTGPIVTGAESEQVIDEKTTRYTGKDVRFRFTDGGAYKVSVTAVGIDLSAIGHGWAVLNGGGFFEPGTFSTDADSLCSKNFKAMPRSPTKLQLGAPSTP